VTAVPRKKVDILGIGVDNVSMQETIDMIELFIEERKPRIVVTADASGIVAAQTDKAWREIIENADLITPDSVGVLWASRRAGHPIAHRVSGVDIVEALAHKSMENGYRLYFLGAAPGVAQKAADELAKRYPGAIFAGVQDGFFSPEEEPEIAAAVARAGPDVLFVAMGIPKQEQFICRNMQAMNVPVSIGVGGSFDVFSGNVKRAPRLVQKMNLEWLWRLIQNPKKWRKVMSLPTFWWMVIRSKR
jgi:N-acetylglucosaminyldiphosphoundecaprenol N-acetyl-beta-D-mannosaminyltransferase